jgi:hypothetical protein
MPDAATDPRYDDDFYVWTQTQAQALRALAPGLLGHRVDIAHVAAEIEDLGRRDVREIESLLRKIFAHLLKLRFAATAIARPHWIDEVENFQGQALETFKPSMRQAINLARAWKLGRRAAMRALSEMGVSADLPEICPFDLEGLLTEDFDIDAAILKI